MTNIIKKKHILQHSIKEAEFFKNVEEMNLLNEKLEKLTHKNQCKDRLIKEHIDNCNAVSLF